MGRLISYEQYLQMLSERMVDNTRKIKRDMYQRRNGMQDLYGICFSANGDSVSPATFYVSISPDCVYLERFAFKFVLKPFTTTVKGATESATVQVDNRSLSINDNAIEPNPHNHGTQPHTHNVINGMAFVHTTSTDFRVEIDGIDVTDYFKVQHDPSDWLGARGEDIYPNSRLNSIHDFYDVLEVCDTMTDEGRITERDKILQFSHLKKVQIYSDAPFGVDAYVYTKYSSLNR